MIEERADWNQPVRSLPDRPDTNAAEILDTANVLFEAGDVVELRAFKDGRTASGYFDDFTVLASEAERLEARKFQVYVTLNPVLSSLLSRYSNRVQHSPKVTTKDNEIVRRSWLPVDLDPVRPSGISATDDEKRAAIERAQEIRGFLAARGLPEPVEADSGNGAHLLYRVELPNDRESLKTVGDILKALDHIFSDSVVNVDTGVGNAARIWKLYGTTARKGEESEERPHRKSRIIRVPGEVRASDVRRLDDCR